MAVSSDVRAVLSTAFVHAPALPLPPTEALDVFLRAEASGVVLDSGLPRDLMEALTRELQQRGEDLPVLAVEAPCPRSVRPGAVEPELCSPERDEAKAALDAALATVRRAGELRASFVVVRLISLVARFSASIGTPGITEPWESLTIPVIPARNS